MMTLFDYIAIAALAFGAFYGLACLANPRFAATSVRLQADPDRPGGFAEFRATFGGTLAGLHLSAIVIAVLFAGPVALAVMTVLAAGWFGAAIGRTAAIILDREMGVNPSLNWKLVGLEIIVGLALVIPLVHSQAN
ncbi:MAG: hypothetical protein AAF253_02305 [Pseudomonadota bacterium]